MNVDLMCELSLVVEGKIKQQTRQYLAHTGPLSDPLCDDHGILGVFAGGRPAPGTV
jgi:hypothetical protein